MKHIHMFFILVLVFMLCAAGKTQAGEILAGMEAAEDQETENTGAHLISAPFSVKIRFDDQAEILTKKDTADWRFSGGDGYVWNSDKVSAYFDRLKEKYDTPSGIVNFRTHKGVTIQMKSDSCGWHLNTPASVKNLEEGVDAGKKEVDPAWNSGLVYSSESEVGDKYVEVSISEQKVFLFENGKQIFETDCVTGTDGVSETKKGVFQVVYKASPSVLRGTDVNGNKYEQPVSYWICFNGSQGLHDAVWRSDFGGDIYKSWGSHGCVNLPLDAAKQIYEEVYTYYPVIVY